MDSINANSAVLLVSNRKLEAPKYNCEALITGVSSPPEAETLLAFKRLVEAANLPSFQKNLKCKNHIQFVLSLQKMKFNRPQYVTDYCTLMKSNRLVHFG